MSGQPTRFVASPTPSTGPEQGLPPPDPGFEALEQWAGCSMAQWRERGYVPDSDEEEEEIVRCPAQTKSLATSLAQSHQPSQQKGQSRRARAGSYPDDRVRGASSVLSTPVEDGATNGKEAPCSEQGGPSATLPVPNPADSEGSRNEDSMEVDDAEPTHSPVEIQLKATLALGLRQVSEALRSPSSQHKILDTADQSSSPLSSLVTLEDQFEAVFDIDNLSAPALERHLSNGDSDSSPRPWPELIAPIRALRQRTQIQLHPYALEDARYQRQLKARGLKPIRMAANQSRHPHNLAHPGRDDASIFSSSPVDESSGPSRTPLSTQGANSMGLESLDRNGLHHSSSPLEHGDEDGDLPDLATIFGGENPSSRMSRSKPGLRAPTGRPNRSRDRKRADVVNLPCEENEIQNESSKLATFFIPPSPPHSGNASSSGEANLAETQYEKQQIRTTPVRLPTPLLSSDVHPKKRSILELSDSSQELSDGVNSAGHQDSSSEDEPAEVGKLKAIRRKMKGVLPASWLKLDLKQQTSREENSRHFYSAHEVAGIKGVAQPLSATRGHTGVARPSSSSRRDPFDLDFSDADPSSNDEAESDLRFGDDELSWAVPGPFSTDVLEDNRVDAMKPARERRPTSSSKPRKRRRQQQLSDPWGDVTKPSEQDLVFHSTHGTSKTSVRMAPQSKKQRKTRPLQHLSVLDAPGVAHLSRAAQPDFLKVVSRRAQRNRKRATQDPSSKFLRLASRRDTEDINQNLINWHNGHLQPQQHSYALPGIDPATDRSLPRQENTNIQHSPPFKDSFPAAHAAQDALTSLKTCTDATIQRILYKKQGLIISSRREADPAFSHIHAPASIARLRTGVNLRKPLRNRAGLGALQKTATHPRPAQVEDAAPAHFVPKPLNHSNLKVIARDPVPGYASALPNTTKTTHHDEIFDIAQPEGTKRVAQLYNRRQTRKARTPQHTEMGSILSKIRDRMSTWSSSSREKISEEAENVTRIIDMCYQQGATSDDDNGWSVLGLAFQVWLEEYSANKHKQTASEKNKAKEIFQRCYELVTRYTSPVCDDLVRKGAWFFSMSGMADPFNHGLQPWIGLPSFLDEIDLTIAPSLPNADDTTFHIFLKILAVSLVEKSRDAADTTSGRETQKKKKIELQSFINRLYPNNGRLLSELESVHTTQLASLWNRCSMYLTLYCYSMEGCRPRLSQFQGLVDFSKSHMTACEVVLSVWQVLAWFHAKKAEDAQLRSLADLSDWVQGMLRAMLVKWSNAESEVMQQLQGSTMNEHAMYIVHTNQENVEAFIRKALDIWAMAVGRCGCQDTAAALLGCPELNQLLFRLVATFVYKDNVLQHMLGFIEVYLHKYHMTSIESSSSARNTMLMLYGSIDRMLVRRFSADVANEELASSHCVNRRLTYAWYLVALPAVVANDKSWDDFLEPAGTDAWERYSNEKRSAQYKTLFVTHIITRSEDVYRDNKFWYLSFWLGKLLRPLSEWMFEHELTSAVLRADQYEPMLRNLPFLLQNSVDDFQLTLADLKHNRITVIERIVEGIAGASATYESQSVDPYALQPAEMADILRLLMRTMKAIHTSLAHATDEQKEYEKVILGVAGKMDWYTNGVVPLDRWFRDTDFTALGRLTVRQRFGGTALVDGIMTVSKSDVVWFQLTCQKAAVEGSCDQICDILHEVYVDAADVPDTEWFLPKQLAMMQQVFPAYLELALTHAGSLIGAPVLRCLETICNDICLRAVNIGTEDFSQVLDALQAIIVAARDALQRLSSDRAIAMILNPGTRTPDELAAMVVESGGIQVQTFVYTLRIARIAILQYQEVLRHTNHVPNALELKHIAGHACYVFNFVRSLWKHIPVGADGHWKSLETAYQPLLKDREANKIRVFAREELEKAVTGEWSSDAAGRWWVRQGREAVQVKLVPTAGLTFDELQGMLTHEMEAYMNAFTK